MKPVKENLVQLRSKTIFHFPEGDESKERDSNYKV